LCFKRVQRLVAIIKYDSSTDAHTGRVQYRILVPTWRASVRMECAVLSRWQPTFQLVLLAAAFCVWSMARTRRGKRMPLNSHIADPSVFRDRSSDSCSVMTMAIQPTTARCISRRRLSLVCRSLRRDDEFGFSDGTAFRQRDRVAINDACRLLHLTARATVRPHCIASAGAHS
jgi:hypothetical protein